MSNCGNKLSADCLAFSDNRKIINVEENSRKFVGQNSKQKLFALYHVDGCIIVEGQKCDFLLLNCSELIAYLIELKGSDLIHAVRQINATLNHLLGDLADFTKINARIVLTKVNTPDLKSSDLIKLEKRIRQLGGTLAYKAITLSENV
jgi:hypothetical protein